MLNQVKHMEISKFFPLIFREVPRRPETQLWTASHTDPPGTPWRFPTSYAAEAGGGRFGSGSEALQSTQPSGCQTARTSSAPVPVSGLPVLRGGSGAAGRMASEGRHTARLLRTPASWHHLSLHQAVPLTFCPLQPAGDF